MDGSKDETASEKRSNAEESAPSECLGGCGFFGRVSASCRGLRGCEGGCAITLREGQLPLGGHCAACRRSAGDRTR